MRHPWADGTTHVAFTPTAFLERLAVRIPRPRVNLVLYHGLLAPHAAWRAEVVPRGVPGARLIRPLPTLPPRRRLAPYPEARRGPT